MTHVFLDKHGQGIAAIEERQGNVAALVRLGGFKDQVSSVTLFAPMVSNPKQNAHVHLDACVGTCRERQGIEATRAMVASINNRGISTVIKSSGFMIAKVVLQDKLHTKGRPTHTGAVRDAAMLPALQCLAIDMPGNRDQKELLRNARLDFDMEAEEDESDDDDDKR